MNEPLADLFRYNQWANRTLFEACRALTDAHLDAQPAGASGTVRELLMHVAGAQQTFVLRTHGRQHEGELSRSSAWPGFEALLDVVTRSSADLLVIAERTGAGQEVDLPFMGKTFRFPLHFFLTHALTHGAEHRTEVKVALAQLGVATPDLDGWQYAVYAGYGQEVGHAKEVNQ